MPGRGTEPGPALYPECTQEGLAGHHRHRREGTRTCTWCREQMRVYMARYRIQRIVAGPRLVPALGTHRRIRALARMGWGQNEVAARLGLDPVRFKKVMGHMDTHRDLAEKVAALYRELCDQVGPNVLARINAERRGWPGPVDWDDPDDPREDPVTQIVIDRAHREALAMHRAWRNNQRKREARTAGRRERARVPV